MDDVARRQRPCRRRLRLTGLTPAELPAFREDLRASRTVDRAVDAAAPEQSAVGSVHDGVGGERGDVALHEGDARHLNRLIEPPRGFEPLRTRVRSPALFL